MSSIYSLTGIAVFRWIVMSDKVRPRQQIYRKLIENYPNQRKNTQNLKKKTWLNIFFYLSHKISWKNEKFEIFGTKTNFNLWEVRLIVEIVCKRKTLYDNIRSKSNCWLHWTPGSYFVPPLINFSCLWLVLAFLSLSAKSRFASWALFYTFHIHEERTWQ